MRSNSHCECHLEFNNYFITIQIVPLTISVNADNDYYTEKKRRKISTVFTGQRVIYYILLKYHGFTDSLVLRSSHSLNYLIYNTEFSTAYKYSLIKDYEDFIAKIGVG